MNGAKRKAMDRYATDKTKLFGYFPPDRTSKADRWIKRPIWTFENLFRQNLACQKRSNSQYVDMAGIHSLASNAFVATNAKNWPSTLPPHRQFLLVGEYPNPPEQTTAWSGCAFGNRTLKER